MGDENQLHASKVFLKHRGILRTGEAMKLGIHPRTLYRMRDEGVLVQISRGVYRLAELPELAHPDLVAVAQRVPRGIVCLVSALAYHEITNEVPQEVQIALPRGTKTPVLDHPRIRIFRFSGPALSMGVEEVDLDGTKVLIYDVAKTVVDCFRFRNVIVLGVAVEALRLALEEAEVKPSELFRYARACRIEKVMRPYIEAMT
ncbi:MAG: type IV toxin-antitoxin system AbiEi family antitoxin domain-containing protein [Deltaproteobacteria bacterium]|nr:type IV toxin-antitoxin system AbiEi family antitoxin domain-containing protein [Deltaproteobacteria bacterium]